MTLIQLVVLVVVLCIVAWLYNAYVGPHLPPPLNWVIPLVFALLIILWLLSLVGLLPGGKIFGFLPLGLFA